MKDKSRPGPVGKSCLTCRQRRKKCDRARPVCERCRKGKFECLGYDCSESDKTSEGTGSEDTPFIEIDRGEGSYILGNRNTSLNQVSTRTIIAHYSPDSDGTPPSAYSEVPGKSSLARVSLFSPQQTSSDPPYDSPVSIQARQLELLMKVHSSQPDSMHRLSARTLALLLSRPPGLSWLPPDVLDMSRFFMSRFERLVSLSFFKPSYRQIARVRDIVAWRLQNFPSTRWAMFMCTTMFDSVFTGTATTDAENTAIRHAITQVEQMIYSTPSNYLTPAETLNRLTGSLELALFRLRIEPTDTYELLRNYAPTFLQLVFSDPTLWPSDSQSTAVSLGHVLESDSYEISHFAMLDMMCSMAYGLPQVVEYDTSTVRSLNTAIHPAELVHGCPPVLQFILSDINRVCAWKQIGPITNWQVIERKLLDWKPALQVPNEEEDSWKGVARLAVQESWRHTLLVYLYMAVCGDASDDPRVATSIRQIFQVLNTVKYDVQPVANAHFFMQYLIGGAFSPNEKHRALARAKLSEGVATKFWLLGVNGFVPVLDHLWHGAAGNGRAVRWSDYVYSRQAIIPVFL